MKDLNYCNLIDAYGALLTEKQLCSLSGFYDDDLSLSEIAENLGISRQAVLDAIKKGEGQLDAYEDRLKLLCKSEAMKCRLQEIRHLAKCGDNEKTVSLLDSLIGEL